MTLNLTSTTAIIAVVVLGTSGAAQPGDPRLPAISSLTVPADRLPPGCSLPPSIFAISAGPTNPWSGTDPRAIAEIRERVDGLRRIPDGPPLARGDLAQFRMYLAEGVQEGYAAVYQQDEPRKEFLSVLGLRFSTAERAAAHSDDPLNPRILRVTIGAVAGFVQGADGPCFQALAAHLKSLATKGQVRRQ